LFRIEAKKQKSEAKMNGKEAKQKENQMQNEAKKSKQNRRIAYQENY
jgi:hypothetical protein